VAPKETRRRARLLAGQDLDPSRRLSSTRCCAVVGALAPIAKLARNRLATGQRQSPRQPADHPQRQTLSELRGASLNGALQQPVSGERAVGVCCGGHALRAVESDCRPEIDRDASPALRGRVRPNPLSRFGHALRAETLGLLLSRSSAACPWGCSPRAHERHLARTFGS